MTSSPINPDLASSIAAAREDVLARIAAAAKSAGRDPSEVDLVAVSKVQPDDRIEAMLATGQRVYGENRVQEAMGRWTERRASGLDIELRLIGPLQTNKAKEAVETFDVIETVDRPRLAHALADAMAKTGRTPELFVQINTGEEPQKAGVLPADADAFIASLPRDYGLSPAGLMCIPPASEPAGPHFALLAKVAARNGLAKLSMGMSADYEIAVLFGATHVRVGSALFGARDYG
ncbi:MAG: YggS family pyridoxal phosphate-dependent enzyme [Hyphomonadaceae bacterium]